VPGVHKALHRTAIPLRSIAAKNSAADTSIRPQRIIIKHHN
jgi:hypothetical protein